LNARTVYKNVTDVNLPITLIVDSDGLHKSLATQSTPRDMSMLADVHSLRLDYESKLIDSVCWIQGTKNPADALTKPLAGETTGILEEMMSTGTILTAIDNTKGYGGALKEEE